MKKQRNINVKEGAQQIDEYICIVETSRAGWLKVEKESQKNATNSREKNTGRLAKLRTPAAENSPKHRRIEKKRYQNPKER